MLLRTVLTAGAALLAFGPSALAADKDIPHLTVMPNYAAGNALDREFDGHQYFDGKTLGAVEGRVWHRDYGLKEGAKVSSPLQVVRNYANAIKAIGGSILFENKCDGHAACDNFTESDRIPQGARANADRLLTARISKDGKELWVEVLVYNEGASYTVIATEREAMRQDVTASVLLTALNTQGRVALYINFDLGKATIRPDSASVIAQVLELLKSNPGLNLNVEGHTDNVGGAKANITLSGDRAKAVVAALVNQGVAASRLTPMGFGQDKPVADNSTESGRAKNRRVELVKR